MMNCAFLEHHLIPAIVCKQLSLWLPLCLFSALPNKGMRRTEGQKSVPGVRLWKSIQMKEV